MTATTVSVDAVSGAERIRRAAPWVFLVVGMVLLQVAPPAAPSPAPGTP
jgi:hypothetical protein